MPFNFDLALKVAKELAKDCREGGNFHADKVFLETDEYPKGKFNHWYQCINCNGRWTEEYPPLIERIKQFFRRLNGKAF